MVLVGRIFFPFLLATKRRAGWHRPESAHHNNFLPYSLSHPYHVGMNDIQAYYGRRGLYSQRQTRGIYPGITGTTE